MHPAHARARPSVAAPHTTHQWGQMASAILCFAFVNVVVSTVAFIPVLLHGLNLASQGWRAVDAALFGSMLGSTDAVAVTAILKAGVVTGSGLCASSSCVSAHKPARPARRASQHAHSCRHAPLAWRTSPHAPPAPAPAPPHDAAACRCQAALPSCCRRCWRASRCSTTRHPLCCLRSSCTCQPRLMAAAPSAATRGPSCA